MDFKPVSFCPPSSLEGLAANLASSLDVVTAALTQGAAALEVLNVAASSGLPDLSGLLGDLRDKATEALSNPVGFLALTPFQHTIGTRKGEQGYLTPDQALKTLAKRFADADNETHDNKALIVLIVATPTPAMLAQALDAFNQVYPIPELEKVCRRASALATLETDKFIIPQGKGFPAWGNTSPQKDRMGQAVTKALGGLLAAGEGAAMGGGSPVSLLTKFAEKQAGKLLQKTEELRNLVASMTGSFDAWTGVYLEGESIAIARELAKLAPPFDHSCKCTTLLCWYGSPEQVAFYKESFGL